MLVLCFVVHQPHSVSVCLFLVRGGRCMSRTAESDSAHAVPKGRLPNVFSRTKTARLCVATQGPEPVALTCAAFSFGT